MGSGFDWKEVYENESNQQSSVLALLYGQGHDDMGRFNAMHPLRDKPGTSWLYSSGDTCTLADAVGKALTPKYGDRYPWPVLFDKLGMKHVAFERDHAGTFIGASYFYATARDAARFGYLYENDGCWKGERLLPEGFVKKVSTVNDAFLAKHVRADEKNPYGLGWWLNVPVPAHHLDKPYPDAPDDMFAAEGHWGQSITVIPSLDLVIVRFADDREHGAFNGNQFLKLAIAVGKAP
jgi:CubicO group peptidase (beta-lactamase class C family)